MTIAINLNFCAFDFFPTVHQLANYLSEALSEAQARGIPDRRQRVLNNNGSTHKAGEDYCSVTKLHSEGRPILQSVGQTDVELGN